MCLNCFKLHQAFGRGPCRKRDKLGCFKCFRLSSEKQILTRLLILDLSTYQVTFCWKPTLPAFLTNLKWEFKFLVRKKCTVVDFLLTFMLMIRLHFHINLDPKKRISTVRSRRISWTKRTWEHLGLLLKSCVLQRTFRKVKNRMTGSGSCIKMSHFLRTLSSTIFCNLQEKRSVFKGNFRNNRWSCLCFKHSYDIMWRIQNRSWLCYLICSTCGSVFASSLLALLMELVLCMVASILMTSRLFGVFVIYWPFHLW